MTLFDGSVHVIHSLLSEPTWDPPEGVTITSQSLSLAVRKGYEKGESDSADFSDVNSPYGMKVFDNSETFVWLHECARVLPVLRISH